MKREEIVAFELRFGCERFARGSDLGLLHCNLVCIEPDELARAIELYLDPNRAGEFVLIGAEGEICPIFLRDDVLNFGEAKFGRCGGEGACEGGNEEAHFGVHSV